jgi:hypothetical protein
MTDARLPGRWLTDMRFFRLSDRAWRTWTYALMFSAEQGTDGVIDRDAFQFLHRQGVSGDVLDELLAAGLVELPDTGGMTVLEWERMGQSMAARVQQQRESNKERQKRSRARRKEQDMGDNTRDVTRYDGGEDRRGQDRPGQAQEHHADAGARVHTWPVTQPGSGVAS